MTEETKIVKIEGGEITLRRPNAGMRNKATIKADSPTGIKQSILLIELIPYCVSAHPWGVLPPGITIKQKLDTLSIPEYDSLIQGVTDLIQEQGDVAKKSQQPSESSVEPTVSK